MRFFCSILLVVLLGVSQARKSFAQTFENSELKIIADNEERSHSTGQPVSHQRRKDLSSGHNCYHEKTLGTLPTGVSLSDMEIPQNDTITTAVLSYDHGGMHKTITPDGPAYLLPKILSIHPFDPHKQSSIGADAGTLNIDEKGNAMLYLPNWKISSMRMLDKNSAKDVLGTPYGPHGEEENKPYFWTFDVLTIHVSGNNLYHIDVQFADADQHWKKYRVRGYQIANPQWRLVD
jgi:hypothetical protein